jgi:hypothetical protein
MSEVTALQLRQLQKAARKVVVLFGKDECGRAVQYLDAVLRDQDARLPELDHLLAQAKN